MSKEIYAPVLVTTICRFEKFKKCIDSLSRCTDADKTDVYIGVDFPAKKEHWDGYRKICEYIPTIFGFKDVHVVKRSENWGQSMNVRDLQERVREKYDRYILTEDDNEFSPNFLRYMNQCLEKYKDDPLVVQICGYSYFDWKVKGYPYNAFPLQGYSAWGAGKWFSKRDEYSNSGFPKIESIIDNPKLVDRLFEKKMHVLVHQMMYRTKYNISGADVRFRCYCAVNDKYSIFPVVSKVRNIGFDDESTNCMQIESFSKQSIDKNAFFVLDDFKVGHYKEIDRIHDKHYAGNYIMRLAIRLEYFWWRRTGKVYGDSKVFRYFVRLRIKLFGK